MKKIYYTLWADCLGKMKSNPKNGNNWKAYSLFTMTICNLFNLIFLKSLILRFILHDYFKIDITNFKLTITYFNYEVLNLLCSTFLFYVFPIVLMNYFLFFHKSKFEFIMKNYKYHEGRWVFKYIILSLSIPVLFVWIGIIYVKLFN